MNILFRVLNDYDIACDPLKNGLASKKLIYDATLSYLEENEKDKIRLLDKNEIDKYCKDNMMKYINTHQYKLKRIIDKRGSKITKTLSMIDFGDLESWSKLLYYLSTLPLHLSSGSRVNTDWISTTKRIDSIFKYYKNQKIHKVAVLGNIGSGIYGGGTLVLDLSSRDMIDDIRGIINKKITDNEYKEVIKRARESYLSLADLMVDDTFSLTSDKFVGYNYANCDNEVCIYRFFPSERVISVLEQIQMDLISLNKFNFEFITLSKDKQILELNKFKEILRRRVMLENDPYLLHVFEMLYLENKNVDFVCENEFDKRRINYNRTKILKMTKDIYSIQLR